MSDLALEGWTGLYVFVSAVIKGQGGSWWLRYFQNGLIMCILHAGVAKLVYAPDSKSGEVTLMSVRVRPPAPQAPRISPNKRFSNRGYLEQGCSYRRSTGDL